MTREEIVTAQDVKEYLRENWEKGTDCPCCGQRVKVYERPIHHSMAVCLINLYKLTDRTGEDYHHVNDFGADGTRGGDFAKLRLWGLIAEREKDENDDTKRTSGFWAITIKGKKFVTGMIRINKKVRIYNGHKIGESVEEVTIEEALGKKFNYQEIMAN